MGRFDGKVALITGASSGIGAALARELARQGAAIALLGRREDRLAEIASQIRAAGGRALPIGCDVCGDEGLEPAVARTVAELGRLDIAVANAGFGIAGAFAKLSLEDFRRQLETNVFGVLRTAFATLPELERTRGTFAIMGSVAGHVAAGGSAPYAMSKFAVRALAASLRAEYAPAGVAVVLLSPGFVDSEIRMVDNLGRLHPHAKDPVPRWLRMPAEVAARKMARAIASRRREAVITAHGKLAVLLTRLSPALVAHLSSRTRRRRPEPKEADS